MNDLFSSTLFLASAAWLPWVIGAVGILVAVAMLVFFFVYKSTTEKTVGSAKQQSEKLLADAQKEADKIVSRSQEESKRAYKEAVLKAKEQE